VLEQLSINEILPFLVGLVQWNNEPHRI